MTFCNVAKGFALTHLNISHTLKTLLNMHFLPPADDSFALWFIYRSRFLQGLADVLAEAGLRGYPAGAGVYGAGLALQRRGEVRIAVARRFLGFPHRCEACHLDSRCHGGLFSANAKRDEETQGDFL